MYFKWIQLEKYGLRIVLKEHACAMSIVLIVYSYSAQKIRTLRIKTIHH